MSQLFGGLFDFNRDGNTDLFEMAAGLGMLDELTRKEEDEARRREIDPEDIDEDEDF